MPRQEPLLRHAPQGQPVTLAVLVGIADAIERESVQRYAALADTMERRGDAATAAAFRVMLDEERGHLEAVARWAAGLGTAAPSADAAAPFAWRLPPDLSESWDDVTGSARLTPYRAFAIAVDNERRAFALYSYLSAQAVDARVAAEAEKLALEELRHAAVMRRWRRQAWHRERRDELPSSPSPGAAREPAPAVTTLQALHALLAHHEAAIAARLGDVAARLRAAGDAESAAVLDRLAATPSGPPGAGSASDDVARREAATPARQEPAHLLVAAQQPLEALSDALEQAMRTLDGEAFTAAAQAQSNVVERLARLALQVQRRLQRA